MVKVLVVCSGNICRSPMGEVILQNLAANAGLDLQVSSAGTLDIAGAEASENSILVCGEHGLGLEKFRSTALSKIPLEDYHQILVMESKHEFRVRELAGKMDISIHLMRKFSGENLASMEEFSDVPDPIGSEIEVYRASFNLIKRCLQGYLEMLQAQK